MPLLRNARNAGRTGTSLRRNSEQGGSKAARNSSIRTEKRTSKLSANKIRKTFGLPQSSRDCPFISMKVSNSQISAMGAIRFSEAEFGSLSKREVLVRSPSSTPTLARTGFVPSPRKDQVGQFQSNSNTCQSSKAPWENHGCPTSWVPKQPRCATCRPSRPGNLAIRRLLHPRGSTGRSVGRPSRPAGAPL